MLNVPQRNWGQGRFQQESANNFNNSFNKKINQPFWCDRLT